MEMKKVALFVAMVVVVSIEASAANNRVMMDSGILLKVDSSLGQCWGKFCAPWSPCQSGCICVGAVGTGACVGLSNELANSAANSVVNNRVMMDSDILPKVDSSLGQCWGKFCAPWSPCQSGCICVGTAGTGFCAGV